ncbi:MAG: hypothetical protein D6730_17810 [Bacteroidetes bacterium]|nr:MAG: hypothetical protein D6730_17810 [Bacteroidota bacterium]
MMKIRYAHIGLLLVSVLFGACNLNKNPFNSEAFPVLETLKMFDITENSVTVRGRILNLGSEPVTDHGFVWSRLESPALPNDGHGSLGKATTEGEFSFVITELKPGLTYYVRAYARTAERLVYAAPVRFRSGGSNHIVIERFEPLMGTWGDTLYIYGRNFGENQSLIRAYMGGEFMKIVSAKDGIQLTCIVPEGAQGDSVPIKVVSPGHGEATSSRMFKLIGPEVSSIEPTEGNFSTLLTIRGKRFDERLEYNKVLIGGKESEILDGNTDWLQARIPPELDHSPATVMVERRLSTDSAEEKFRILPPQILALSSEKLQLGDTLTITGLNFHPLPGQNHVMFDIRQAEVVDASVDALKVKVPEGPYQRRRFPLSLEIFGNTTQSQMLLTLNKWVQKPDLPLALSGAIAFVLEGRVFMGLGNGNGGNVKDFWTYSSATSNWSWVSSLPGEERQQAFAFTIGEYAYIGGGSNNGHFLNDFWQYHAANNSWQRLADIPGPKGKKVAFELNGEGYVLNYLNGEQGFWKYDAAQARWVAGPTFQFDGLYHAPEVGFSIGGAGYVIGMMGDRFDGECWQYKPELDQWQRMGDLPRYSAGMRIQVFQGNAYALVGHRLERNIYVYDHASDSWSFYDYFGGSTRYGCATWVESGRMYVGGGVLENRSRTSELWEYEPNP